MTSLLKPLSLFVLIAIVFAEIAASQDSASQKPTFEPGDVQTQVSRVYVFVDKTGFGHQHGVEANLLASRLILGAEENAGTLVFDMTSFKADTARARQYVGLSGTTDESTKKQVTDNMLGSSVLNAKRFPTASFEVTSARPTGQTGSQGLPTYELTGQFTLHGVTRPLRILANVEQARGWLHLRGAFAIKQSDYGITPFSKAFGAIGVANELKIYGDLFIAPTDQIAMSDIPERK